MHFWLTRIETIYVCHFIFGLDPAGTSVCICACADPEGGKGGKVVQTTPEKSQKYRVS